MKLAARLLAIATFALPALAGAATPQVGVEQKLRRGFFTETDLGTYFDVGGGTASNAQAYMQLGVGYDITDRFTLSLQFGLGASSGVCLAHVANDGTCGITDASGNITTVTDASGVPQKQVLPDNFSNTFYQLNVSYRLPLAERLGLVGGVVAGYQKLDPAPLFQNDDPTTPISGGFMAGVDLSLEYATNMDHFFVGLDVVPRYLFGPNLFSMAIFPRVKYTF
ncbi:MAG: adventurous gliding motility protein CglE [Deltaproteobacteria bacterium]|nr:adventurous gliding motility protein CglE [Deltaproteobacteria bacterium]